MDSSDRIIPRERLTAYERWELGSLNAGAARPASSGNAAGARTAVPKSAESIQRANAEAREKGYAAGYAEGLAAGRAAGETEYAEACAQLAEIAASLTGAADTLGERLAERMLALSLSIAKQVVRAELSLSPEAILPAVREAVPLSLEATRDARLRVNPADAEAIDSAIGEMLAAQNWKLVPDAGITAGGCVIESASGEADARMETRWQQVLGSLAIHPAHTEKRR